MYITIDGDDVGRKITACYINNDEAKLQKISEDLACSIKNVSVLLEQQDFRIVFCAADGVVAVTQKDKNYQNLYEDIRKLAPDGLTFSAGVGYTLQEAYVALLNAKCSGKNSLSQFHELQKTNQVD